MNVSDINELKDIFERELKKSLERPVDFSGFISKRLDESTRYALLSPGKRLRPLLVLSSALAVNRTHSFLAAIKLSMWGALAVEYIHCYSLVHDDLPAMDDDDIRRGKPTLHRQFDEGLAILAGDALLADAFYFASLAKNNAAYISRELAQTAGSRGLAAGQAEDLNQTPKELADWHHINAAKTGRLFEACAVIGGLSMDADRVKVALLRDLGRAFGSAFQIKDDLEDQAGLAECAAHSVLKKMLIDKVGQAAKIGHGLENQPFLARLLYSTFGAL